MIQITQLQKNYNGITVLNIPTLTIPQGESFGLVGNNGAGKTTFFRLILDLIEATSGEVIVDDEKVMRNDNWKAKVGSFLDEGFLIDFLTPEEYFSFTGKLYHKSEGDIASFLDSIKDFFNAEILGGKKLIRDFSKGNQKKVGIAAALMPSPRLVLLDEPFTGIDPIAIREIKLLIRSLSAKGIGVLLTDHNVRDTLAITTRAYIISKGIIVAHGEPQSIIDNPLARETYLGQDFEM